MPSKRAFAKRLAALAATGLGVGDPIDALTAEQFGDGALAVESSPTRARSAGDKAATGRSDTASGGPRSAVAAGAYDPAATAAADADTVVTGRLDPTVLAATGLPSGLGSRVRRLLGRYDSVSLGALRRAAGGAALTADGPAGCAVAVGDVDAAALVTELDADPDVTREPDERAGFVRFRAREIGSAVAVTPDEVVAAFGPTAAAAAAHRDAGVGDESRRGAGTTANYGPLPSLLGGDATVCVDLGPDARRRLRRRLGDAPAELRAVLDASSAVGASLRVIKSGPAATADAGATGDADGDGEDGGGPSVALRYGAVADPRRLDRETAEALARAVREGDAALSDATVARHGRTVVVDAAAGGDLFAAHGSLFGVDVGDPVDVAVD
ncbi:hypothetical protein C464_06448 [Halorubrum coriense DSM 10284]|uniref:Uncharacterized protein n=1 Tax=Halorubrum coriense DSM 10284 TaxID=1227466 RepID=M0ENZ8_9EURY|nr:hypothetical protein [Halorubrum coriense]ELZ48642.1 hypothetical protein C464_06448 [Halorubrum coriense DSM 10284]